MKNEILKRVGISFVAALMTFLLLFTNLFYTWDKILLDEFCQTGTGAHGLYSDWRYR